MSLSFEESLKNNVENNAELDIIEQVSAINIDDMSVNSDSIMTLDENLGIAAYSGDDGNWQQHPDYVRYSSFSDDSISIISEEKEITLSNKQFNITQ